jgi:hypothetical protein
MGAERLVVKREVERADLRAHAHATDSATRVGIGASDRQFSRSAGRPRMAAAYQIGDGRQSPATMTRKARPDPSWVAKFRGAGSSQV